MEAAPDAGEIVSALQTALLVVDPAGRIAQANAAAEAALNMSAGALRQRALPAVLALPRGYDPESDAPFAAFDVDMGRGRSPALHGDFMATPLADRPGWRLISIHAAATVHRMGHRPDGPGARTAIGVAAMLAHEIKNPLSGIRGAAQLIESKVGDHDAALTRLIRTEVDRIAALLDQMEGFTDTRSITPEAVNVHEVIDHARDVAAKGFGAALRVQDAYDPSLPSVFAHRDSLIQVLLNLLKNAAETTDSEGRNIKITTAYRHGFSIAAKPGQERRALPIELCVIDDGPGAPPDIADALFVPFVTSKRTGRGLGLALADKLMRDMGGIIQYAREGNPEMTVFRLLLPRAEGRG